MHINITQHQLQILRQLTRVIQLIERKEVDYIIQHSFISEFNVKETSN